MKKIKKLKLNTNGKRLLGIIVLILLVVLTPIIIRTYKQNTIKKLGYDDKAINAILHKKLYNDIKNIGYSKTINYIITSKDFKKQNIEKYKKINYVKQVDLCKNINALLKKGYTTKEISLIVKNGTNKVVNDFVKKDYIENISSYLSFNYAKTRYIDRYIAYYNNERDTYDNVVTFVNIGLDKEFYTDIKSTDDYSDTVLVNKYSSVSEKYKPKDLMSIDKKYWIDNDKQQGAKVMVKAFEKMSEQAEKEGLYLLANSTYRSYKDQEETYNVYKDLYGDSYAIKYAAKAGFSEHQTGLVVDIASKKEKLFANSKEFLWVKDNAYKYGFILRYPKGKEYITGYKYEAWHYRYVGKKIAKYIHEHNMTYDEYYYRFIDKEK